MQHLEEGAIHSWLDGALSAEEAARVSAHVEECAQCAAAVAEARGFIAASSRILTALDHVPKGVVPIGVRAKPRNWTAWRAAAAVLVVALGSFSVLRERMGTRQNAEVVPFRATTTAAVADRAAIDTVQRESSPTNEAQSAKVLAKPTTPPSDGNQAVASKSKSQGTPKQDNVSALAAAPRPLAVASDLGRGTRENSATSQGAGTATTKIDVGAARVYGGRISEPLSGRVADVALSTRAAAGLMSDPAVGPVPIRVVGTPRAFGEKRTLYEIAPGDTVLLAEAVTFQLDAAVVTASGATRVAQSADTSAARQIKIRGAAPAVAAPPSAQSLNGVTTLTWTDASGNTMKLSGRHSYAELLEIRRRIEQLRAAEAAAKKTK
ncbi:MAG: zf-HC2 domain-containing protein [Gemmatimonadaceae bacterium]